MCTLAIMLKKRGIDVSMLTYHDSSFFMPMLLAEGIPCRNISRQTKINRTLEIRRALRTGKQDVVLAFLPGSCFYAEVAALPVRNWGLVVSERTAVPGSDLARFPWKRILHHIADYVVTNSHTNKLMIEKSVPRLSDRVVTIYNAVDLDAFHPGPSANGRSGTSMKIAVAASHQRNKNLAGLVEAMSIVRAKMPDSRVEVDWFGDVHPDRTAYDEGLRLIRERRLDDCVRLYPAARSIADVYNRADCVALFSFREGLPNAMCEAMACGRPVLMSNIADAKVFVRDGTNGFLFDPASPEGIAGAIMKFCELGWEKRVSMGKESRKLAETLFNPETITSNYIQILHAAAGRKGADSLHLAMEILYSFTRALFSSKRYERLDDYREFTHGPRKQEEMKHLLIGKVISCRDAERSQLLSFKEGRLLQFLFAVLLISCLAFFVSSSQPKGGVWENHLSDGLLFLKGSIPRTPGYPMWGYSLLAGILRQNIIFFQAALLIAVFAFWYRSLGVLTTSTSPHGRLVGIMVHPIVVAMILVPFISLSISYYSNSVTYMLAFCATWMLYLAVEGRRGIGYYAAGGLLTGLAFNFRSEILLLGFLETSALFAFGFMKGYGRYYSKRAATFAITLLLMTLPWALYTGLTVRQPLFSSTNSGGVMYLGLGILPNNPWNIIPGDEYVGRVAREKRLGSPWSIEANRYFKSAYAQCVKEHPKSFTKRVVRGWVLMLAQGLYFPDFRCLFFSSGTGDEKTIGYLIQRTKFTFGLGIDPVNWVKYGMLGVDRKTVSFKHYAVFVSEFLIRFMYLGIFLTLLCSCIVLCLKAKLSSFAAYVFVAYAVFLLFTSGFIQTVPRHTTIALPVLLSIVIVLLHDIPLPKALMNPGAKS